MRDEYELASQQRDYHFEEEVLEFLRSFLRDNERKIDANKKRLELSDETPEMETKVGIILDSSMPSHVPRASLNGTLILG